ncbi:MAG: tRNA (adenosine(37)-N6)-threonylcarbamoyltransferase complex ATPase subunit type 1 TsaE [Vicinamibacteria bacterium]|nr:tRNA (adenosine(37)-N6)-threonylcarbamoyltransferase complex ATPase subunit type 1 TsaE [Vicinamibacteria bacterium]
MPGLHTAVVHESRSEAETEAIAVAFAGELSGGEVIFLEGDLGAGKTAFVRGLARGLGAPEDAVASPTFVIQTTYPCASGRLLHHADLYRLASELGAEDVGLFDLPGPRDILAVEWAARMRTYPWKRVVKIDITHAGTGDDHRRIEIAR